MLVLTRRPGEQIVIADNIRITVVAAGPNKVRLGIEAPPEVTVDRLEVHERRGQCFTVRAMPDPPAPPGPPAPARPNRLREVLAAYRARKARGTGP
jgi:carbon storage regulator